jgi:EAL domain-containing protein (putative c-di-GMP-specific phosphodiesterase class I)
LTEEELMASHVLTLTAGTSPGIADFARVISLDRMIAANQAIWLETLLREDRYTSFFQPMYSAQTGHIVAVEALFRGLDEHGGMIAPGFMFDLARKAKMMFQLDLAARRSAVNQGAAHKLQDLLLFINFNPSSIYDPAYCLRTTISTIRELGFRPENIVFEVTESERVTNLDHLKGILAFYRRSGFKIALDDVGAGYSGLNLLRDLRPDFLKIDMHLVRDIDTDVFRQSIVGHVIGMAKDNSIRVVAEGIETEAERSHLRTAGVDLMQGFLMSKPRTAADIAASRLGKAA